jgi:hypothetical protein
MKSQHTAFAVVVAAALSLAAATAEAQASIYYNFDTASGAVTPTTLQGATFSSPSDPGAFAFAANPGLYNTITAATVLTTAGYAATLDISFAQAQTGVSFEFAGGDGFGENGNDLLTVTANTGQTWTVSPTVSYLYPEGLFNVASAPAFTSLAISETYGSGASLTQDSLTLADLSSTPVPLPPSALLLAGGLVGLGWKLRRKTTAV